MTSPFSTMSDQPQLTAYLAAHRELIRAIESLDANDLHAVVLLSEGMRDIAAFCLTTLDKPSKNKT
jgi:hypothetical protein